MFFRTLLVFLSLSCSELLFSQESDTNTQIPPATLVLKSGATIFSADDNFNQQVVGAKVIVTNSNLSYQKNTDKVTSLKAISKAPTENRKGLQELHKAADDEKQKEALKKIEAEIIKHHERTKSFLHYRFKHFPSSEEFVISTRINQSYVVPNHSYHDNYKACASNDVIFLRLALDFLHSQKFTCYNNKSLDFCFSEVFSVRPPPVLV